MIYVGILVLGFVLGWLARQYKLSKEYTIWESMFE